MRRTSWLVVITLVVVACGSDAGTSTTTILDTTTTQLPSPTISLQSTTTTSPASTTTVPGPTTTTLPGEAVDFGPGAGDALMVIGVRYDDVLNLRAAPGATQQILGTISPLEMGLEAIGETRTLSGAFWTKVQHQGKTGWVHMGFVGYAGDVEDQTAAVVAELGGYPTATTMTELGLLIAAVYESDEVQSKVVQVTPVTSGDLVEVSFDVIGFADDAVGGARLHIFAEKVSDGFALKTVEVRAICIRGVDDDGLCI